MSLVQYMEAKSHLKIGKIIYTSMRFMFKGNLVEYDYNFLGNASTILFLHGWGGNKDSFAGCKKFFSRRFSTLTISLPPDAHTPTSLTMHDYQQLVIEILRLHNITSVIIICHSFGMRVSLMLAATNLNIEKIMVTGGAGIILEPNFISKLSQNHNRILLGRYPQLFQKFASTDYKNLNKINRQTFKNIIKKNLTEYINLLGCQALLFWGKKDTATPIRFVKIFKKLHPNSQVVIVDGTHFAYLEYPQLFIEECRAFLEKPI